MFLSLDFIYLPARDFEAMLRYYVEDLKAELVWRVRGMGTIVAHLRLAPEGPGLLLAEHLEESAADPRPSRREPALPNEAAQGQRRPGLFFRNPHGPIFRFDAASGQRFAVYQLTRPEAATMWAGRMDP